MDILNYEYLKEYGVKYELQRRKKFHQILTYHIFDILLYFIFLLSCFKFNIVLLFEHEKSLFYDIHNSLFDVGICNILKLLFSLSQFLVYSKIYSLGVLSKCNIFSRHFTGILAILVSLKLLNFHYVFKFTTTNAIQLQLGDDFFYNVGRIVLLLHSLLSGLYFYFCQFRIYRIHKCCIVGVTALAKIWVNRIRESSGSFQNEINIEVAKQLGIKTSREFSKQQNELEPIQFSYNQLDDFDSHQRKQMHEENNKTKKKNRNIKNFRNFVKKTKKVKHSQEVANHQFLENSKKKEEGDNGDIPTDTVNSVSNSNKDPNNNENFENDGGIVHNNKQLEKAEADLNDSTSPAIPQGDIDNPKNAKEEKESEVIPLMEEDDIKETIKDFKKILLPYLWPSKRVDLKGKSLILRTFVILIFVLIITSKVFSVIAPMMLGYASDNVTKRNLKNATYYIIMHTLFTFISKFLRELCGILYSQVQQSAFIELQESIFESFHKLPYEWYSNKNAGGIIRTVDRGTESANSLMNSLLMFIFPASIEGIVTCAIFIINYNNSVLGSILYIGLIVYIYSTIKITKWRKKIRVQANKMDSVYHDIAHDSLANYETVKYFNNETYEVNRFCDALSNYNRYNLKILNSLGFLNSVQQLILNLTLLFTLYCAIEMIITDGANTGTLVSVIVYIANVFAPLTILGTLYTNIVKSFTDLKDLINALREKSTVIDDSTFPNFSLTSHEKKFGVSVEFTNVCFHYPSQPLQSSLSEIDLFIPAGTTCAVVGHTGSGKTTLSKLLFRFYDVQGSIKIGGRDISTYKRASIRSIIGIVPQDTILFNETIRYNILYGRLDASEEELVQAARSAQLLDFIESLPSKWETVVGDRGVKLSGGERQRISIARCLLKDPKIVIFDEATSLLDSKTEYLFQKAVEDLRKNRTLIIIAHRLSTITTSEQVVLLKKGKIIERGNHQSLLEKRGEYAQMWELQSKSGFKYVSGMELEAGSSFENKNNGINDNRVV